MKASDDEGQDLWGDTYSETVGPEDIKEKIHTFHQKHDEDVNYDCKKCNKKISAHNRDWHHGLCDDCFDEMICGKEE